MSKYAGRYFIRSRVWHLGTHIEAEVYPVFQRPGVRRGKCRATRECQRLINQRNAEGELRRLILVNFSESGSLEAALTFRESVTAKEAAKAISRLLRKLRKLYKAAGQELRYLYIPERGRRSGRWHYHLLLSPGPVSRDELEQLWQEGHCNTKRPQLDETGLAGMAAYLSKQYKYRAEADKGKRRWSCSKNLIRPEPVIEDGEITVRELGQIAGAVVRRSDTAILAHWPGMTLVEAEAIRNLCNRGTYVRLRMAVPECWHGRRPVARYLSGEIGAMECWDG